jgi:hypothetical protein
VTINSASARTATLTIRYANGATTARPMDISLNGTVVATGRSFASTGTWDTWVSYTLTVSLNAGANTLRLVSTSADGGPNLDYFET